MTRPLNAYGGGWVGVSGQLTTSDSYKSWYPVYLKSSFFMRALRPQPFFFYLQAIDVIPELRDLQ